MPMSDHIFTATIVPSDDWWAATCLEFPGANGQGKTEQEAMDDLKESVRLLLSDAQASARENLQENQRLQEFTLSA